MNVQIMCIIVLLECAVKIYQDHSDAPEKCRVELVMLLTR